MDNIHLVTYCVDCGKESLHETVEEANAKKGASCCKKGKKKASSRRATPSPSQPKNEILNDSILRFTVSGKTVSKSNSYRMRAVGKFAYMYKTQSTKDYEELVSESALRAVARNDWLCSQQPISINVKVFMPDARARDLDNVFKSILDPLEGIVFYNDSQVVKIIASKHIDRDNPRTELTVKEVIASADQVGIK